MMTGFRLWQITGWTMLHYLWFGKALGMASLLVRQKLRAATPGARYGFAVGSLLLLSMAPAAIAVVVAQSLPSGARHEPRSEDSAIRPDAICPAAMPMVPPGAAMSPKFATFSAMRNAEPPFTMLILP